MKRELPLTIPALAAIAVVVVVAVGGYFGLIAPKRRAVAQLEVQLRAAVGPVVPSDASPITDEERATWKTVQDQVRGRFVKPENQLRLLVETGQLARSIGLTVTELQLQQPGAAPGPGAPPAAAATPVAALIFPVPPNLALNPAVVRLVVRNSYRDLVTMLDRVRSGNAYVALQSLDVRRVDNHLESDIRLASLRWVEP